MATPLNEASASEIVAGVQSGSTTCEAVARACLEHIAAREPSVEAWQYLDADAVIDAARVLDRGPRRGLLSGVPFGVKDIIDTGDMPTEYGSAIYSGYRPRADAACVALSRKAGALLMGKTVTTEFANRHPGKTRHPLDPARTPGGSSSGSAAAVADMMVPLAIGTQTTGSTIKPASFCGVFGFKPTHDDLRCSGVKESAHTLDTLGLMARSIDDIALFRQVLLGCSTPAQAPVATRPLNIGFCRTPFWDAIDPSTQHLLEDAARSLAKAGASVQTLDLPAAFDQAWEAHQIISSFEFARNYTWEVEHHWNEISDTLRNGRLKSGLACTFQCYSEARDLLVHCRQLLAESFKQVDVLITLPVVGEAPLGLNSTGNSSLCAIWTAMQVPALTMPVFRGPNGLPIGLQLIAARNADQHLFAVAKWIHERLT
jgi:Asp-tRNA(Asn)/Glu-tRNA(Gln) amidotransferase A subunit family amidase